MTKFLSVLLLPLFAVSALCAFPQPLTAVNTSGASVAPSTFMLGREFLKGWQSSKKAPELVFRPDALSSLSASPAYLRIAYLDRGLRPSSRRIQDRRRKLARTGQIYTPRLSE